MIKVFASEVVVCRGFENRPAIKFSDKGDFVRFRVGMKVYDTRADKNYSLRPYPQRLQSSLRYMH